MHPMSTMTSNEISLRLMQTAASELSLRELFTADDPAKLIHELLARLAKSIPDSAVAVFNVSKRGPSTNGPELSLNRSLTNDEASSRTLESFPPAVLDHFAAEIYEGSQVIVKADQLAGDQPALGASTMLVSPVMAGSDPIAVLVCLSQLTDTEWTEERRATFDQAALGISAVIMRDRAHRYDRISALLAYSCDILSVLDANGTILFHTPAYARVVGHSTQDLAGTSVYDAIHPDDQQRVLQAFSRLLEEPGGQRQTEVRLMRKHDSWRYFEILGTNQIDNPLIGGIVVTAHDVTDRKHLEQRLNWQALHDPLTKLANRELLLNDLRKALARSQRSGNMVGLLHVDLDEFKGVNDHFGHSAGDQLLIHIAERLTQCVRAGDTVARLDGDEYVILLDGLSTKDDARKVAARVLDAVRMPVRLSHGSVTITASMGICLVSGDAVDPDSMLVQADSALYQAKNGARARFYFYGDNHSVLDERDTCWREPIRIKTT